MRKVSTGHCLGSAYADRGAVPDDLSRRGQRVEEVALAAVAEGGGRSASERLRMGEGEEREGERA
eukprot:3643401-Rhodomonas_salina.1